MIYDNTTTFINSNMFVESDFMGTYTTGYQSQSFQKNDYGTVRWKPNVSWISSKLMNKAIKSTNGNRTQNSNLNVVHWNGGAKKWINKKLEIESLLSEKSPDVCYISEANLWDDDDIEDKDIPGYRIVLPNTMNSLKHACLIVLIKSDLIANIVQEKSNKDAAMIWIKVGTSRKKLYTSWRDLQTASITRTG